MIPSIKDSYDSFSFDLFSSDAWRPRRRRRRGFHGGLEKELNLIENPNRFESFEGDWGDNEENVKRHYRDVRHNDDDDNEGLKFSGR